MLRVTETHAGGTVVPSIRPHLLEYSERKKEIAASGLWSGCVMRTPGSRGSPLVAPPRHAVTIELTLMPNLLEGKTALILGIANKWSLAYAIAQAFWREGATLALTYLGDRQKIAIEEMSAGMPLAGLWPCDVTKEDELLALTESLPRSCTISCLPLVGSAPGRWRTNAGSA